MTQLGGGDDGGPWTNRISRPKKLTWQTIYFRRSDVNNGALIGSREDSNYCK